jgi:hypothetical protein
MGLLLLMLAVRLVRRCDVDAERTQMVAQCEPDMIRHGQHPILGEGLECLRDTIGDPDLKSG